MNHCAVFSFPALAPDRTRISGVRPSGRVPGVSPDPTIPLMHIHGIAHASVVVTFGKNQPFFDSKGKSIKEMEACGGKKEETGMNAIFLKSLSLVVFISGI